AIWYLFDSKKTRSLCCKVVVAELQGMGRHLANGRRGQAGQSLTCKASTSSWGTGRRLGCSQLALKRQDRALERLALNPPIGIAEPVEDIQGVLTNLDVELDVPARAIPAVDRDRDRLTASKSYGLGYATDFVGRGEAPRLPRL